MGTSSALSSAQAAGEVLATGTRDDTGHGGGTTSGVMTTSSALSALKSRTHAGQADDGCDGKVIGVCCSAERVMVTLQDVGVA